MIAVIADDFTGAAEIGGIVLKKGLRVQIDTSVSPTPNIDLLIIATDTRSMPKEKASVEIKKITSQLLGLNPSMIYKKMDSVFRGNIYDELVAQMKASNKKRAILIAGNPLLNRVIKNGVYYVGQVPLALTSFANDPDFPSKHSQVKAIVGNDKEEVVSLPPDSKIPDEGIIVGDIENYSDMKLWAEKIDDNTLAAGGSGFFDILLSQKFSCHNQTYNQNHSFGNKALIIFGSTFPKENDMMGQLQKQGMKIMDMPLDIYEGKGQVSSLVDAWAQDIADSIKAWHKVVVTVSHSHSHDKMISTKIEKILGQMASKVLSLTPVDDLLVEGGATTSAILKHLNIQRLFPFNELCFGVIQMKIDNFPGMCLTTKPGSYAWPDSIISTTNKK